VPVPRPQLAATSGRWYHRIQEDQTTYTIQGRNPRLHGTARLASKSSSPSQSCHRGSDDTCKSQNAESKNGPSRGHSTATNGPFQGHSTAVTTTKFATRPAPPTQDELRQLGLQDEFSRDEDQEEQPPPKERNNGTKTRDRLYQLHNVPDGIEGYAYIVTRDADNYNCVYDSCQKSKSKQDYYDVEPIVTNKRVLNIDDHPVFTDESYTRSKPALLCYRRAMKYI
jgi:hypothetical protein